MKCTPSVIGAFLTGVMALMMPLTIQASSFQSYAKDSYYLGVGGMPPSLEGFAADPRAYLRSEAAYQSLKEGFETPLNRSLSDAEFSELLSSSRVRAEQDCVGSITTAGINAAGEIGWSSRPCYFDEKLIELQVNGRWQVVASQGCFNLIEPPPQPERTIEISSDPMLQSAKVFVQETQGITVHVCDCPGNHSCHNDIYLPGYRAYLLQP